MRTDTGPFEKISDQTTSLFESSNVTGFCSPGPVDEETSTLPDPAVDPNEQVRLLTLQLENERRLNRRLLALTGFAQGQENVPDPELTAHNMAKKLSEMMGCELAAIFGYQPEDQRYRLLACAGPGAPLVPNNYSPDLNAPVIGQALQRGIVLTSSDTGETGEAGGRLVIGGQPFLSILAAPLLRQDAPRGLILLADPAELVFGEGDAQVVEAAAVHLLNAWDFARQNEVLTEFVQTVTMMSVIQESASLLEMVASIARRTLDASYALVATQNQQEWLMRGAGRAPQILRALQNGASSFLEKAIKSPYTFRMDDLRRDVRSAVIPIDSPDLCTLLASPIRVNGLTIGILLAFGKNGPAGFTNLDVFLAERLTEHAAVNLESCYLNQELRANLKTTQLLYDLSLSIAQAETLNDAASAIARTAYRLMQARECGLILFSPDGRIEAEVRFPSDDPSVSHPFRLIQQAIDSRQTIYLAENENVSKSATPIQTMRRCYGALWMEYVEEAEENLQPTEEIRILVNQAAVALERSILLEETRQQAEDIARAYEDLLYGLTRALDARDRETEWHSKRVEELSVRLGIEMGLTGSELKVLKRGALLHDIGKIGVPDSILHKPGPLNDSEWEEMRRHPQKGAEIVQEIPALRDALPVIAFHQERWDGSGYPEHLQGTDIPLMARLFAVVDVYDALTSDRPYRTAMGAEEALKYLSSQAGTHFDPQVVEHFAKMIRAGLQPADFQPGGERPTGTSELRSGESGSL